MWHNWGRMVRTKPNPPPIDAARLSDMALAYVARFATSRAKLENYLRRKLRERGWAGEGDPPVGELAERMVSSGYVDDAAYARAKSGSLLRRGYGLRRVSQALGADGIAEQLREDVRPGEAAMRRAALAMARKRRFGPFAPELPDGAGLDRAVREKQIAAMLRAGHPLDSARRMVDAPSPEAAESWAEQADEDDACE